MKLLSLKLENFQGIKEIEIFPNGQNVNIFGDNATGKTTIFNSFTWLLFDKPSTDAKGFTPKTKTDSGDMHHLNHSAEGIFMLDGGRTIKLSKTYHEIYKKKRGAISEEFSGHTTDYYVDGVPSNEKEYQETVLSCCNTSPEIMKILTVPHYFSEVMSWDARRKILLEMCGDMTDKEIIDSNPELEELLSFLQMPGTIDQYYTVEEYRKIASSKKAEINKMIQEIPSRIDEATKAIPDTVGINAKEVQNKISLLQKQKSDAEIEKSQASIGDIAALSIRNKIAEAEAKMSDAKSEYMKRVNAEKQCQYEDVNHLRGEWNKLNDTFLSIEREISQKERTIESLIQEREELYTKYQNESAIKWDDSKSICPTCKRPLPEDEVEEMKNRFNESKSKKLEQINADGQKCSKDVISQIEEEIKILKSESEACKISVEAAYKHFMEARNMAESIGGAEPFETTNEYAEIKAEIDELRAENNNQDKYIEKTVETIREAIRSLEEEIREQEGLYSKLTLAEIQRNRIDELKNKEKELSRNYEKIEKGIFLCELFIKSKVQFLDEKINNNFKNVKFRLFQEQINGGIKDDCEVMIPGERGQMVPFSFANNAARINAGLEIISSLSKFWKTSLPVFVDNAESVTRLLPIDAQIIRLIVSEKDKVLRIETEREAV